jgi:acetyltransferase-like isoleucine patch superfamily enzyme
LLLNGVIARIFWHGFNFNVSITATARSWRQVKIGSSTIVKRGVDFHSNDHEIRFRILIGNNCYIGQNCFFSAGELIELKNHCLVGASCNFLAAGHEYSNPLVPYAKAPVISYGVMRLGVNTWVGAGSTLVGNVEIGFGSIIAAGTIVRHSFPPLCLVAGNPARIVKFFDWTQKSWLGVSNEVTLLEGRLDHHLASLPREDDYLEFLLPKN